MTEQLVGRGPEAARNLALVNYGLLFASIFFAGVPALIAVIIAYSQRDEAPAAIRSHHDFQIRIFWVAFALTMAARWAFFMSGYLGRVGGQANPPRRNQPDKADGGRGDQPDPSD